MRPNPWSGNLPDGPERHLVGSCRRGAGQLNDTQFGHCGTFGYIQLKRRH